MDIVTIDGIPVYRALVDDADTGMLRISLVDDPAVQSNFLAFGKQKKVQMYAVQDDEKRLVLGVVMRADFPIYRRDDKNGEYYVIYTADTIRKMAEKYLLEGRQNEVNIMHEEGSDVDGVNMVQYFIKGDSVQVEGFDDIAVGSLFAEFHVSNDDVWAAIKDGTYRGFSLEGFFDLQPEQSKTFIEEVVDALNGIFSRIVNPKQYERMKKKGLMARLARLLVEMGNVTTDKGVLSWDGEEDLKAGDKVYIEDENGERTPAEDGDYTTTDAKVIVVVEGEVAEIKDAEAQVAPQEGEFASKATDNGTLEWEGDEDLKAGDEVFITDAEGNRAAAPDGDYKTEDGKIIVVVDGKVAEIKDADAEVEPQEETRVEKMHRIAQTFSETYEEKTRKIYDAIVALGFDPYGWLVEAADDYAVYCVWGDTGERYSRFDVAWDGEGNAIVSNPVEVEPAFVSADDKAASEAVQTEVETLRAQVAKLSRVPAGVPAHEAHESAMIPGKTGDKGLDRIACIRAARQ